MRRASIHCTAALIVCWSTIAGWAQPVDGTFRGAGPQAPDGFSASLRQSQELENNEPQRAFQSAHEALAAARLGTNNADLLAGLIQTARTARGVAAYPEAETVLAEGLAVAGRRKDDSARAQLLIVRGMTKWNLADLPAAMAAFLEARDLTDKVERADLRIDAECGLGLVYGREQNRPEALVHFQRALDLAERNHDPRLAAILNDFGNAYLASKDYPLAQGYFERSLALASDGSNQRLVAYVMLNLGEIANRLDDQAAASKYLGDALEICNRYDLPRGVADIHYLLARVERSLGHPEAAASHLDTGMAIAAKLGNPDLFASYFEEYTLTREAQGDYQGALAFARELAAKTDEIRGERSRQQLAELQSRYELEARNRRIKLLQRDTELQQSALDLKQAELSRTSARYYALGAVALLAAIVGALFIARQRTRVRRAARLLAEVSTAKEVVEASEAQKSRLLDIAAHNLHESEALFRDAFARSPLGLALVSLDGRWLRVNRALCQIVGYSEEELLGTTSQAVTHPEDLNADMELLAQLLRGDIETYQLDKRYIHRQGHSVWIRLNVSLHHDAVTGLPRHCISQVQDITAQRRAETQLQQAKEGAESASTAKNEFLSRMSHELRTPLNAILGFGQLLELQDLGTSHNQGVSYILTAGRHLLGLINEVLDLSRIESGKFAFTMEPICVSELITTTLEMMRPLAEAAGVSVTLERCTARGSIHADPRRLNQVLLNLISNAIKFNHPGGRVTVACHENGGAVQIAVSDTGPGIAASDKARIFAPFARLPATLEVPGTGLGLSLSKALTEGMGGTLRVLSEPGVGSTFTIEFARAEPQELLPAMLRPIVVSQPARPVTAANGVRHKVLYIEDDLINLELIERLLALNKSLHLLTATRGDHGLEIARTERPELILLDVHLTDMDGADVLSALRQDPATEHLPVIIVSADAMGDQIERMQALGAQAYLTKPIDIDELRRTIDETIHAAAR